MQQPHASTSAGSSHGQDMQKPKGRGGWLMKCGELVAAYRCEMWEECDMLVGKYENDKVIKGIVEKKMEEQQE